LAVMHSCLKGTELVLSEAPGKMILIGEYAVLEGAPALVCALECYARVRVKNNDDNSYSVESPSLQIEKSNFVLSDSGHVKFDSNTKQKNKDRLNLFSIIFREIYLYLKNMGQKLKSIDISIDTDDFYSDQLKVKYGFGSSAAMASALIEAVLSIIGNGNTLSANEKFSLAYMAHRKAQGNLGSGIDVAASVFGGVLKYQLSRNDDLKPTNPIALDNFDQLQMFPVWAGHSTSTREMIRGIDEFRTKNKKSFNSFFQRLSDCSAQGIENYKSKKIFGFLSKVQEYNQLLLELGEKSGIPIVSDQHQLLTEIIEDKGGYYKPSGAGGGDIGICFFESPELKNDLVHEIETNGFKALNFDISQHGVRTLTD
jgi:phosphomevalonate kinase